MSDNQKRNRIISVFNTGILVGSSSWRGMIQARRLEVKYFVKKGLFHNKILSISIKIKQ